MTILWLPDWYQAGGMPIDLQWFQTRPLSG